MKQTVICTTALISVLAVLSFGLFAPSEREPSGPEVTWEKVNIQGDKPEPRVPEHMFWYEGDIYLLGGVQDGSNLRDVWKFDTSKREFKQIKVKGDRYPRVSNGSGVFTGKKFLFFGGSLDEEYGGRNLQGSITENLGVFDPDTHTLTFKSIPERVPYKWGRPNLYWDGNRLIAYIPIYDPREDKRREVWTYNPGNNQWKHIEQKNTLLEVFEQNDPYPELYPGRPGAVMFGADREHIYCIVMKQNISAEEYRYYDKYYRFDFETNRWEVRSFRGIKPEARMGGSTWTGEYFIMFGGWRGPARGGGVQDFNDLWVGNPGSGDWQKVNVVGENPDLDTNGALWNGEYYYLYGDYGSEKNDIWRIDLSSYLEE